MTQENLLDAVVDDLKRLFTHDRLANSMGAEREIRVFPQDLPCREGDDEETQPDKLPEPYVLVRLQNGTLPEQGEQQTVKVILVACVFDPGPQPPRLPGRPPHRQQHYDPLRCQRCGGWKICAAISYRMGDPGEGNAPVLFRCRVAEL